MQKTAGIMLCCLCWLGPVQAAETGIASAYDYPQKIGCPPYAAYDRNAMTAAHKTLPCGTKVRVTGVNGRSIVVSINDRGPYVRGRIIDLSYAAAQAIGMGMSIMRVKVDVIR